MEMHELKIDSCQLFHIVKGSKTHEVRVFDRDFKVGDVLKLNSNVPNAGKMRPSGYALIEVTDITAPGHYGLPPTVGVMSIRLLIDNTVLAA